MDEPRVPLSDLWKALEQHALGMFCDHCGAPLFDDEERDWLRTPDGETYCFRYLLNREQLPRYSYRARPTDFLGPPGLTPDPTP